MFNPEVMTALATASWTAHQVDVTTFVGDLYKLPRGRWVAVCMVPQPDGTKQMRGARCSSKAKARAIANKYGGVVRHYRAKNWRPPPPPKVNVHSWVYKFPPTKKPETTDAG